MPLAHVETAALCGASVRGGLGQITGYVLAGRGGWEGGWSGRGILMLAPRLPRRRAIGGGQATLAAGSESGMRAYWLRAEQNGTSCTDGAGKRQEASEYECGRGAHRSAEVGAVAGR